MVFKMFFNKDYRHYRERGEQLLGRERYAEARLAFQESLQKLPVTSENFESDKRYLTDRLAETGNRLGLLNLAEAEHALHRGDHAKAQEHILLVLELAEDVTIREKAEKFMRNEAVEDSRPRTAAVKKSCAGCADETASPSVNCHVIDENLPVEDRFELLVQTLPAPLVKRYVGLGEKFAYAYISAHDGDMVIARRKFEEMLSDDESDILHYELSVIAYNEGKAAECEGHLRRALELDDTNSLSYLALVHLLIDTDRIHEAVTFLHAMLEKNITPEQAIFLLGEVHALLNEHERAIEFYSQALTFPDWAKVAAERLIPQLEGLGRHQESQYLFKRYLKGCC